MAKYEIADKECGMMNASGLLLVYLKRKTNRLIALCFAAL